MSVCVCERFPIALPEMAQHPTKTRGQGGAGQRNPTFFKTRDNHSGGNSTLQRVFIQLLKFKVSALSAFSHIPARREGPPELSYFHRVGKTGDVSTYDAIFNRSEGYNEKLHRCDREHASSRGLNINEEEMARPVAVLSSSEYGRRVHKPLEQPIREHVKIDRLQAELYRTNGVTCLMGKPPSSLEPF
ncbi:hypothetical protein A306_00001734 [Columba livia]|uniref:Uncharacterized protein n=1 Tax=Columba livia TaxID=8932 RepID=A0A2I0MXI4_COLLI|nr:hypothetical protein A306_00001734 [Columba livia]